jgi:hypothetical protein
MSLEPEDMGYLTGLLLEETGMPLSLVLEGGYGPSHGTAVGEILRALGGTRLPCRDIPPGKKTPGIIAQIRKIHGLR